MSNRPAAPSVPTFDAFIAYASLDDLSMVLRSHLALEFVLNTALDGVVPPDRTDLSRLPFMTRVDLAVAFGKVPDYLRPGYKVANELRNRFAHRLDATITAQDANQMLGAFTPDVWDGFMFRSYRAVLPEPPVKQVAFCFFTLFFHSAVHAGLVKEVLRELLPAVSTPPTTT